MFAHDSEAATITNKGSAYTIPVTGAAGFIGRKLVEYLRHDELVNVREYVRGDGGVVSACSGVDVVVHLAGENRPSELAAFEEVNAGTTRNLVKTLRSIGRPIPVLFASRVQASLENPCGRSKKAAEGEICSYAADSGVPIARVRPPNVFGKWSRQNYNSVVAPFCYNSDGGIPLGVDDPDHELHLIHVDDVVRKFAQWALDPVALAGGLQISPVTQIRAGELAELIEAYVRSRSTRVLPDLVSPFARALYGTVASFNDPNELGVPATLRSDARGWLFEVIKSPHAGQIFMSSTHPGQSRGDHWHDTKVEKFTVVNGRGEIYFRQLSSDKVIVYEVSGDDICTVDIPTGYVHAIRNVGDSDLLVLFWASEMLDPRLPDTHYEKVLPAPYDD